MSDDERERISSNVAAVSITLDSLVNEDGWAESVPGSQRYAYHLFGGFPGFWSFCARAGAVFHELYEGADSWIEEVDSFCAWIADEIRKYGAIPSDAEMRKWRAA